MKFRIVAFTLCLIVLLQGLMGCASNTNDTPTPDQGTGDTPAPTPDSGANEENDKNDGNGENNETENKPSVPEITYHTVTFDLDGGYTPIDPQSVKGGARAEKPADPKRVGYLFAGWTCGGTPWNFASDRIIDDTTLTATWTAIPYSEGLKYTLLENGTYSVSIGDEINSTWIHIPPTHNGVAVTEIDRYGFANAKNLLSIIIPNSVTRIGQYALSGCDKIQSLTLPFVGQTGNLRLFFLFGIPGSTPYTIKNVVVTGEYPLYDGGICYESSVTEAAILWGTYVGESTFEGCMLLEKVYLPSTLERIDARAFDNCQALREITLPAGVTYIGERAFLACNSLRKIIFKGTMAQWEAIEKATDWNRYVENCQVYCTDGTIDL